MTGKIDCRVIMKYIRDNFERNADDVGYKNVHPRCLFFLHRFSRCLREIREGIFDSSYLLLLAKFCMHVARLTRKNDPICSDRAFSRHWSLAEDTMITVTRDRRGRRKVGRSKAAEAAGIKWIYLGALLLPGCAVAGAGVIGYAAVMILGWTEYCPSEPLIQIYAKGQSPSLSLFGPVLSNKLACFRTWRPSPATFR